MNIPRILLQFLALIGLINLLSVILNYVYDIIEELHINVQSKKIQE